MAKAGIGRVAQAKMKAPPLSASARKKAKVALVVPKQKAGAIKAKSTRTEDGSRAAEGSVGQGTAIDQGRHQG